MELPPDVEEAIVDASTELGRILDRFHEQHPDYSGNCALTMLCLLTGAIYSSSDSVMNAQQNIEIALDQALQNHIDETEAAEESPGILVMN